MDNIKIEASEYEASTLNIQEINMPSFSEFLKLEFIKKVKINKSFSLRSYALFLDVNFGTLSQLISEKRKITVKTIQKIAPRLNATDDQINNWISQCNPNNITNLSINNTSAESQNIRFLQEEELVMLSEWYHDAIIELVNTKYFKQDISWIARTLSISKIEAEVAVERLFNLKLIRFDENDNWVVSSNFNSSFTTPLNTNTALKKYQTEMLQKSIESIELISVEERTHSTIMVALSEEQLHKIRDEIKALRKKINDISSSNIQDQTADSVYCFSFSGFPLSSMNDNE